MKNNGITLIEVLLYVAIFTIILTITIIIYISLMREVSKNKSIIKIENTSASILNLINKSINSSSTVNTPINGSTSNSLSLNKSNSAYNPTLFYVDNSILYVKEGSNDEIPLTDNGLNVDSISFSNISTPSTDLVSIKITITLSIKSSAIDNQFVSTFYATSTLR